MANTVWILGAGFSRPLGGPLLNDMLTPASIDRVRAAFPNSDYPLLHDPVDHILRAYRNYGPASAGNIHWGHAEEFLEFLDAAARAVEDQGDGAPLAKLHRQLVGSPVMANRLKTVITPKMTAQLARRLMAAECSYFYVDVDTTFEKWQPYRRWVGLLEEGDAIVTFNYDTVVEKTIEAPDVVADKLRVIVPGESLTPGCIPLLKLHGSLDWRRAGGRVLRMKDDPFFALSDARDELVIASPGPTKQDLIREVLDTLWAQAEGCIREAEAIVFVGYRFPPSDSTARERLMKAISANTKQLHVHTVLGPDVMS